MSTEQARHRGIMMTELIVSILILGMILVVLAVSLNGFKRLNNYQLVRQRCVSAAQATLDSIAATGSAIDDNDFKRVFPDVRIKIEESEGLGQWKGLKLVTVTADAVSFNKKVGICLSRYYLREAVSIGEGRRLSALQER